MKPNVKPSLTRAADRDLARELLQAAMAENLDSVRDLISAGAECGMDRADVDDLAILMDGANTQMFGMLNLHEAGKALNAPLYFAAFRGNEPLVNYFLNNTALCLDSLNAALYGAAAAGEQYIVSRLIDIGADAACADGACVDVAIAKGHEKVAKILLAAGKSYTTAIAAYIDRGNTSQVIELLAEGAAPLQALKAVSRQLSDYNAARDHRQDSDYKDVFDIVVSYATGHGDDIPALLKETMSYATDRGALGVIAKIIVHPEYKAERAQLDAALSYAASSSFRGFNPATFAQYEQTARKLMEMGADPQTGLEHAAPAGSVALVEDALSRGADPRRHKREAIMRAFTRDVLALVQAAEQRLDKADYAALQALASNGLDVAALRRADPVTGRTGLMVAAAAGEMKQALAVFAKEGAELTKDDLVSGDNDGYRVLDVLCDRGQAGLLLDRNLWLMREDVYKDVHDSLPESIRTPLAPQHAETLSGLKSHRDTVNLRRQAEEHRKRFRPK